MPTLLELAEIPVPDACQGRSLVEMIAGDRDTGREVAISGVGVDLTWGQRMGYGNVTITAQDERWCLIDSPDASRRELYDKKVDRAEEQNVISEHPQEARRLQRAVLDFLANHDAHPAWVRWFETGDKGDLSGYQHRSPYLAKFMPYFMFALDMELHG
jgi:hypothetical protein